MIYKNTPPDQKNDWIYSRFARMPLPGLPFLFPNAVSLKYYYRLLKGNVHAGNTR